MNLIFLDRLFEQFTAVEATPPPLRFTVAMSRSDAFA